MRIALKGGSFDVDGLPVPCSGESSSGVFVAAQQGEPVSLGWLPTDVLARLEREAAVALAEARANGTTDEPHVQYMRDVARQCRCEREQRGGAA